MSLDNESVYPHASLPDVDYARHPAYARARHPLGDRMAALLLFARGFAIAFIRWLSDFEHLPKPPDGANRPRWLLRNGLGLAARAAWFNLLRLSRKRGAEPVGTALQVARDLEARGIHVFALSPEDVNALTVSLAPAFARLETRLEKGFSHFDDNRLWINRNENPPLFDWLDARMAAAGVIAGSSHYLARPVRIVHVIPQINSPKTDFWSGAFADLGLPDPVCNYCHVDTAWGVTKMILYLGPVGRDNGPFSFVPASPLANRRFWDRMVRKANDYAGLSATKPTRRALFSALPRPLQKKGAFGVDMTNDHQATKGILETEWTITSEAGNAILFDPEGIHRGGMVRTGERRIVTLLFGAR